MAADFLNCCYGILVSPHLAIDCGQGIEKLRLARLPLQNLGEHVDRLLVSAEICVTDGEVDVDFGPLGVYGQGPVECLRRSAVLSQCAVGQTLVVIARRGLGEVHLAGVRGFTSSFFESPGSTRLIGRAKLRF